VLVSAVGALVAVIGTGVLARRSALAPRGDLIAWSVATAGLAVALIAQVTGHLSGFGAVSFRAMELGAQVIAPLALILGMSEVAAVGLPARFSARLFIPALAIIGLVVLATDPLTGVAFTKAWPSPAVYYQLIPAKLLEYGLAPATVIVLLIAFFLTVGRSGSEPAWRRALLPQLAAGVAAGVLALPGLSPALKDHLGLVLPLSSLFAVFCLLAAGLTWYAGASMSRVSLDVLHRTAGEGSDDWADTGNWDRPDQTGDFDLPDEPAGTRGYSGRYLDEPPVDAGGGYRGQDDLGFDDGDYAADHTGDYRPGGLDADRTGEYRPGGLDADRTGDYPSAGLDADRTRDYPSAGLDADEAGGAEYDPGGYGRTDRAAAYGGALPPDRRRSNPNQPAEAGLPASGDRHAAADRIRAELFGQIAIYTLLEDRADEFDRLIEQVVERVRASEPDTLVYNVHAVPSAPLQRILYEVYRDRGAFEQHRRQPYVAKFELDRRPYVLATNVIELGLQQAKVSPFPSIEDLFGESGYDTSGFQRPDYLRDYGGPPASSGGGGRRR
jgi:quinol monooxygenase YgiN